MLPQPTADPSASLARRQDAFSSKDESLARRWVYFNAVEFEWCDDPTESQIAWQIYAALAYGAKVSRHPVRLSSSALLLVVEPSVVRLSDRPAGCCRCMAAVRVSP